MNSTKGITFGDRVRVIPSPETDGLQLADRVGLVYGETTPSVTGVEVIGQLSRDYAVNVYFEDTRTQCWLSEDLVDFVDHAAGSTMSIGKGPTYVRQEDGSWSAQQKARKKRWWHLNRKE